MSCAMDARNTDLPDTEITVSPTLRIFYLALGWLFAILGAIGAFLPILPTVPFLLVSAWAWAKSSKKLHAWLYGHKIYGPYLVAWDRYGVIPPSGKAASLIAMTAGWVYVTIWGRRRLATARRIGPYPCGGRCLYCDKTQRAARGS